MAARLLPLFPLPVVLFPGVPLPLHVFEPHYRELLDDCLQGDRCFGLVFQPPDVPERALARGHVGCVARIETSETLPDGRSNLVVAGVERFALQRLVDSERPYLVGEVAAYVDQSEGTEVLEPLAERLRWLFERVGRAARTLADDPDPLPSLPDDPALLSFTIASLVDIEPAKRQRLLVSRSPTERLRELDKLLKPSVPRLESRAAVHMRAKGNGHGPTATP